MKLYTKEEFKKWLFETIFKRDIRGVQHHHTWKPNYDHWMTNPDPLFWCESMKTSHLKRGFSDIAQNMTICPDGSIVVCRDFNITPAGIQGKNTGFLCIESIGDFDNDLVNDIQAETIVYVTALLSRKFNFNIDTETVIYHTWYASKTCPGLKYFGGNTKEAAKKHLYPLILQEIDRQIRIDQASN